MGDGRGAQAARRVCVLPGLGPSLSPLLVLHDKLIWWACDRPLEQMVDPEGQAEQAHHGMRHW